MEDQTAATQKAADEALAAEAEQKAADEALAAEAEQKAADEALAAEAAKKAPKGKKAPVPLSAEKLRARIAQIEAGNHQLGRAMLVEALTNTGAKIREAGNETHIEIDGVKCQTTAGLANALSTWCSKARRAILHGEAV